MSTHNTAVARAEHSRRATSGSAEEPSVPSPNQTAQAVGRHKRCPDSHSLPSEMPREYNGASMYQYGFVTKKNAERISRVGTTKVSPAFHEKRVTCPGTSRAELVLHHHATDRDLRVCAACSRTARPPKRIRGLRNPGLFYSDFVPK